MSQSETVSEAVARIGGSGLVIDGHSDIPMADVYPRRSEGERHVMQRVWLPRLQEGGVRGAIGTVHGDWARWGEDTAFEGATRQAVEIIDDMDLEVGESGSRFTVARTGSEMEAAMSNGSFAMLLGLEGAKALEGSLGVLRALHRLGVRSISLTHNPRNQLADGAGVRECGGLTARGREVVEEMDRLPVLLDLAHISERSFYDALQVSRNVPIVSHTGCRAMSPFRNAEVPWRNIDDAQIQTIADRKGVVGIASVSYFLTPENPAGVGDCVRHIEYAIQVAGIDHVGMGFDFMDYGTPARMGWLGESGATGWMEKVGDLKVEGLEDVTKVPNLTAALVEKGYSDGEVGKIMGGNMLRVFKTVLG